MKLVQSFMMVPSLQAHSKQDAIGQLVDQVASAFPHEVKDVAAVRAAVFKREESMSTGLNYGVAVPHGRTDAVTSVVGAIAIVDNTTNENGTLADYDTIDHSAVQIIVLTVAPESAPSPYLQLMAYLSRVLRSPEAAAEFTACKSAEAMRKFFRKAK